MEKVKMVYLDRDTKTTELFTMLQGKQIDSLVFLNAYILSYKGFDYYVSFEVKRKEKTSNATPSGITISEIKAAPKKNSVDVSAIDKHKGVKCLANSIRNHLISKDIDYFSSYKLSLEPAESIEAQTELDQVYGWEYDEQIGQYGDTTEFLLGNIELKRFDKIYSRYY